MKLAMFVACSTLKRSKWILFSYIWHLRFEEKLKAIDLKMKNSREIYVDGTADTEWYMLRFMESVILNLFICLCFFYCIKIINIVYIKKTKVVKKVKGMINSPFVLYFLSLKVLHTKFDELSIYLTNNCFSARVKT